MNSPSPSFSTSELQESTFNSKTSVPDMTTSRNGCGETNIQSILVINSEGELSFLNQNEPELNIAVEVIEKNRQDDDDLAKLLKSWELYDQLYVFLKEKNINIEGLKCMKERHIDQLFLEHSDFNTKMIFEAKLSLWQNESGIFSMSPKSQNILTKEFSVETWLNGISSPSSRSNTSDSDVTVLEILTKTEQGRGIIETYKKKNCLNPEDRTNIVHKIVQFFTENGRSMTVKKCETLADEITKIFPKESSSSYFVPGKNKVPPKGKLYDRYRGQRRSLLQLYKNEHRSSKKSKILDVSYEGSNKESLNETEMQAICDELKQNRNWDTVIKLWMETMSFRRRMIDQNNGKDIQTVLHEWPLYKYSRAPELINIDYNFIKPNNGFDFVKWQKFRNVALELFTERVKSSSLITYLQHLKQNNEELDIDNLNIAYTNLLHGLLPPSSKHYYGKFKKFTIEDSKNSFILEVENASQVEPILQKKREECLKSKMKLQPIIIVVGEKFNFNQFYVSLDNVKFKLDTFIECIDFYLKLAYVLNIQYPPQCFSVWVFIQFFFFNIQDGPKIPAVQTLSNDLNSLIT